MVTARIVLATYLESIDSLDRLCESEITTIFKIGVTTTTSHQRTLALHDDMHAHVRYPDLRGMFRGIVMK